MSKSDVQPSRRLWVLAAFVLVAVIGGTVWWSQSTSSAAGPPATSKPEIIGRVTPTKVTVDGKPVSGPPPVELTRVKGKDGQEGFVPHFSQPPVEGQKTKVFLPGGGNIEIVPVEGAPPAPRTPVKK